jgi:hypothetical protein
MFCPECGLDYDEGMKRCTDCDVTLITDPEEEETLDAGEFLPFVEVTDVGAFALVTSQLEQAGVAWFVQSEEPPMSPAEPAGSVAVIYVAENHFGAAREALESVDLLTVGERA